MTPRTPARPSRRGTSLVEVMATLATLTVVLGLSVALVEMLLKLDASGRQHVEAEAALARLARVFRDDVRGAGEVSRCAQDATSSALTLKPPGGDLAIEYQALPGAIVRVEWSGSEVREQERFRIPPRSSPRFERSEADGRRTVALVLKRRSRKGTGESAAHALRIEATPGASLRFAPAEEDQR